MRAGCGGGPSSDPPPADVPDGPLLEREKLTGNWWGARHSLESKGITFDLAAVYVFQNVVSGGVGGTRFAAFSEESDSSDWARSCHLPGN